MLKKRRKEDSEDSKLGDQNEAPTADLSHREDNKNNFKIEESLLMIAAKNGNLETVKFLLRKNVNFNHMNDLGETASDIAWTNKRFDILIELLENDAPFPQNFNELNIESKLQDVRFKILIENRGAIHDAIENNFLDELQVSILNKNLKFAYGKNNQCALTTAIQSRNFEAYSFLRSIGFAGGIDFYLDFHLQKLNRKDKSKLRKSNLKYFHCNINQHVMDLVSKSRLGFGNDQNNFSKTQKWFEKLDDIPEISSILKIVASSDKTDIVFDFNSDCVKEMDPTGSEYVKGRTYNKLGNIFIGAKRRNDNEVLGTLAHELTHFALQLVYNNDCLPFHLYDESSEKEFVAIVETYSCESYKARNKIIANAFCYHPKEDKMRELIARVPHLLALHFHEPEVLTEINEKFSLLFNFFEHKTLSDLKKEENLIKPKQDIKKANNYFGVYAKALQSKSLTSHFSRTIDISRNVFISSSAPDLVLECLVKQMKKENANEINSNNVFVNLEQMLISENMQQLKKLAEIEVEPKIFIIEESDDLHNSISEEVNDVFTRFKIIFISKKNNSTFHKSFLSEIDFYFQWDDLNKKSKSKILASKVIFQGFEVVFNEIASEKFLQQCESPIGLILEPSKLKLQSFEKSLPILPRVFIERTFQFDEYNSSKKFKSELVYKILQSDRRVLISDAAGMGKSASVVQIARELKLRNHLSWVVFIDLKQHTKAFLRDDHQQPEGIDSHFYALKLLKLESFFEQKLFEDFFETKRVIFIVDGFDEISPKYKKFVMKILKSIKNSGNQLLVTTRPHLAEELKSELQTPALKLLPFTKDDQINFLTQFWKHTSSFSLSIRETLRNIKLGLSWKTDFYSTPIHIFMLAEVINDQDQKNLGHSKLNIYSLYKRFFTMKLNIWNSKGPLASADSTCIQQSNLNLKQIFSKLALDQFFDELEELNLLETPEDIVDEVIARVGIVTFGPKNSKQFTHLTFAEFFAADYILNGISTRNPQKPMLELFVKSLEKENAIGIRKFLNHGICHFENKINIEIISNLLQKPGQKENIKTGVKQKRSILTKIFSEAHAHLMAFFLTKTYLETNEKVKVMKIYLFEADHNIQASTVIWDCVKSFEKDVRNEILFAKDGNKNILSQVILSDLYNFENNILRHFLEVAMNLLNEEEFLKLLYGEENDDFQFYKNATNFEGTFKVLWEAAKHKLSSENLKKLAIGSDEEDTTIPTTFTGFNHELLVWLEDVKTLLSDVELSELLVKKNKLGQVMFHNQVPVIEFEDFEELWEFVEENVNEAGQRELIFNENNEKKILIELSIENQDKRVSDCIFDITESLLQEEGTDIIAYFRDRYRLVDFIFETAIWSSAIFEKILWEIELDELRAIFLSKNPNGENILHCLVKHKNENDKTNVWKFIVENINHLKMIRKLLFEKESFYGRNVFHLAASRDEDILITILNWCKINFCHEHFKNIFLEKSQENGFTLMHVCGDSWEQKFVEKVFAFVEENFSSADQEMIFSLRDDQNRTPREVREEKLNY